MDSILLIGLAAILILAVALFAGIGLLNKTRSGLDHAHFATQWRKIEGLSAAGGASWQVAIMEADKLLDQALKARGYPGVTMGDRLKAAGKGFMNTNAVWDAHKLRNRLAHETDVSLNKMIIDRALSGFKAGLKDLGAL